MDRYAEALQGAYGSFLNKHGGKSAVGALYKLIIQLTHSLKPRLVSTLEPMKRDFLLSKFAFNWVKLWPLRRGALPRRAERLPG